jgi:hypothetical protein
MRLVVSGWIVWPVVCVYCASALAQVSLAHQNVNMFSAPKNQTNLFQKLAVK